MTTKVRKQTALASTSQAGIEIASSTSRALGDDRRAHVLAVVLAVRQRGEGEGVGERRAHRDGPVALVRLLLDADRGVRGPEDGAVARLARLDPAEVARNDVDLRPREPPDLDVARQHEAVRAPARLVERQAVIGARTGLDGELHVADLHVGVARVRDLAAGELLLERLRGVAFEREQHDVDDAQEEQPDRAEHDGDADREHGLRTLQPADEVADEAAVEQRLEPLEQVVELDRVRDAVAQRRDLVRVGVVRRAHVGAQHGAHVAADVLLRDAELRSDLDRDRHVDALTQAVERVDRLAPAREVDARRRRVPARGRRRAPLEAALLLRVREPLLEHRETTLQQDLPVDHQRPAAAGAQVVDAGLVVKCVPGAEVDPRLAALAQVEAHLDRAEADAGREAHVRDRRQVERRELVEEAEPLRDRLGEGGGQHVLDVRLVERLADLGRERREARRDRDVARVDVRHRQAPLAVAGLEREPEDEDHVDRVQLRNAVDRLAQVEERRDVQPHLLREAQLGMRQRRPREREGRRRADLERQRRIVDHLDVIEEGQPLDLGVADRQLEHRRVAQVLLREAAPHDPGERLPRELHPEQHRATSFRNALREGRATGPGLGSEERRVARADAPTPSRRLSSRRPPAGARAG
ncbi:MAG: hypothetical protein AB1689_24100 [Thermodesulfobacteriota bacterium]